MSTIDPQEDLRRSIPTRPGSPRGIVQILISDVLILASGVALVRGLYSLGTEPPLGSVPDMVIFMPIGMVLGLVGFLLHLGGNRAYHGRLLEPSPLIGMVPLYGIGAALGAWWGWFSLDRGLMWIPLALSALALLLLIIGFVMRASRRARNLSRAEIASRGRIVPGTVTHCPIRDPHASSYVLRFTVKFTDTTGTDRWVTKVASWTQANKPSVGGTLAVLFDPADPGNERHIWVGLAGATRAEEFFA